MQTFGKRQYAHIEIDPWARKKPQRQDAAARPTFPVSRVAIYLAALLSIGVIAFAGYEILLLA